MLAAAVATLASTSGPAPRYTPQFPPSWDVKQSTWVMACNYSGFLSPEITASWGVVNKFVGDTILGAPWPCHGARPPSSSRASGRSVVQWWCPAWWRPVVAQGCGRHICDGRDGLQFECEGEFSPSTACVRVRRFNMCPGGSRLEQRKGNLGKRPSDGRGGTSEVVLPATSADACLKKLSSAARNELGLCRALSGVLPVA